MQGLAAMAKLPGFLPLRRGRLCVLRANSSLDGGLPML
jgi:hypothetical protein